MATRAARGEHLDEDADEAGVDGGEVGATAVNGEGREPLENGRPRVGVRARV